MEAPMEQRKRHNFYIDQDKLTALNLIGAAENRSASDLLREGVDRVIADRLASGNQPPGEAERQEIRAQLDALWTRIEPRLTAGRPQPHKENDAE
jgi:hypothetical protein